MRESVRDANLEKRHPAADDGAPFAHQIGMRSGAEEVHQRLVEAIDHASHSLAVARESLGANSAALADVPGRPAESRVRAEVGRVARLLEEAREPGQVTPETIEGAAHALDCDLDLLAGRTRAPVAPKVVETRLEERDGGTWITGLCPFCWERVAVLMAGDAAPASTRCSSGHQLAIVEQRSAR